MLKIDRNLFITAYDYVRVFYMYFVVMFICILQVVSFKCLAQL